MFAPKQFHSSTVGIDKPETKSPKYTPQKQTTYKLPVRSTSKKPEAEIFQSSEKLKIEKNEKLEKMEKMEKTEVKPEKIEKKNTVKLLPDTIPYDRPKTDPNNLVHLTSPSRKGKYSEKKKIEKKNISKKNDLELIQMENDLLKEQLERMKDLKYPPDFNETIKSFEQNYNAKMKENDKKTFALKEENDKLKTELHLKSQNCQNLEKQVEELRNWKVNLVDYEQKYNILLYEHEKLNTLLKEQVKEKEELREKFEMGKNFPSYSSQSNVQEINNLLDQIDYKDNIIKDLRNEMEKARDGINKNKENENLKLQIKNLQDDYLNNIETVKKKNVELEKKLISVIAEYEKLNKLLEETQKELSVARSNRETISSNLKSEIGLYKSKLNEQIERIHSLTEENMEWRNKYENLSKENRQHAEERTSTDIYFQYIKERMEMQKEIDDLKNKLIGKEAKNSNVYSKSNENNLKNSKNYSFTEDKQDLSKLSNSSETLKNIAFVKTTSQKFEDGYYVEEIINTPYKV